MILEKYFEDRYSFLKMCAHNIVSSKKKRSHNIYDDSNDLLGFMIDCIYQNKEKFEAMDRSNLEGWCLTFMRNQWNFKEQKDNFNTVMKIESNSFVEANNDLPFSVDMDVDYCNLNDVAPEMFLKYLEDLKAQGYDDEHLTKILFLKSIRKDLELHEQALWDMYFIDGMNFRDIAKHTGISLGSIFNMYRTMKQKILLEWEQK